MEQNILTSNYCGRYITTKILFIPMAHFRSVKQAHKKTQINDSYATSPLSINTINSSQIKFCTQLTVTCQQLIFFILINAPVASTAPCGLHGCENKPIPLPGWTLYKVIKPGICLCLWVHIMFVFNLVSSAAT